MTQQVSVFDLVNERSRRPRRPYRVKWRVNGRDRSRSFVTKGAAEVFRDELLRAADRRVPFERVSGLPVRPQPMDVSWFTHSQSVIRARWDDWAGHSRRSFVDISSRIVTAAVVVAMPPADPQALAYVRRYLRDIAFRPEDRRLPGRPNEEDLRAERWLAKHSACVAETDSKAAQRLMQEISRTLTGQPSAISTAHRSRQVLHLLLEEAVYEAGLLATNPLARRQRRHRERPSLEIDPRMAMSPPDFELLYRAVVGGRYSARYAAYYATLYYGGARPAEVTNLRVSQLQLPRAGWGRMYLATSLPTPGARWTDSGDAQEERELKWRSADAVRAVPLPPRLVTILRGHLSAFPPIEDRVFSNVKGQPMRPWSVATTHQRYRRVAFGEDSALSRTTPYNLRHANASLLLNAGVPLTEVARRLGHSPDICLKIYAGVMRETEGQSNGLIDIALGRLTQVGS